MDCESHASGAVGLGKSLHLGLTAEDNLGAAGGDRGAALIDQHLRAGGEWDQGYAEALEPGL
jgi:hypothetical protein